MDSKLVTKEDVNEIIKIFAEDLLNRFQKKNLEYGVQTPFHNFEMAAKLQENTPEEALGGFLAKHIINVYDMIKNPQEYNINIWEEKLGDIIVYCYILLAMEKVKQKEV